MRKTSDRQLNCVDDIQRDKMQGYESLRSPRFGQAQVASAGYNDRHPRGYAIGWTGEAVLPVHVLI